MKNRPIRKLRARYESPFLVPLRPRYLLPIRGANNTSNRRYRPLRTLVRPGSNTGPFRPQRRPVPVATLAGPGCNTGRARQQCGEENQRPPLVSVIFRLVSLPGRGSPTQHLPAHKIKPHPKASKTHPLRPASPAIPTDPKTRRSLDHHQTPPHLPPSNRNQDQQKRGPAPTARPGAGSKHTPIKHDTVPQWTGGIDTLSFSSHGRYVGHGQRLYIRHEHETDITTNSRNRFVARIPMDLTKTREIHL